MMIILKNKVDTPSLHKAVREPVELLMCKQPLYIIFDFTACMHYPIIIPLFADQYNQ